MRFIKLLQTTGQFASKFRYKKALLFGLANIIVINVMRRFIGK